MRYVGRHRTARSRRTTCQLAAAAALLAVLGPDGASGPTPPAEARKTAHTTPVPATRPSPADLTPIRPETTP